MIRRHALFRFAAPFVVFGCSPLAGPAFVSAAEAQEVRAGEPRQIIVTGVGEASGTPDIATTSLTVLRTSATARAALDGANAAMAEVVGAMKTLGVEARDLQTSGFQIAPQYRYDTSSNGNQQPPTLIGYEVRNTLTVRIRDIAAVGAILDRAVSLGVNQGGDLAFTIDKPAPLRAEARRRAVEDARATAEALAEAAGVGLGAVVSISAGEESAPPMPLPMARMAMAAPEMDKSVPVEAGENTLHARVRMIFEIAGAAQ